MDSPAEFSGVSEGGLDRFLGYIAERDRIRYRKESGDPWPWTDDEILSTYKFTNVLREHDKTSRELISRLYRPNADAEPRDILWNAALSRYFGTWEFAEARGWMRWDEYSPAELIDFAQERRRVGKKVFTGAYVITNGGIAGDKVEVIVDNYLTNFHQHIPNLIHHTQMTRTWEPVARTMSRLPGFGGSGFMTKETLLDTMYTRFWSDGTPGLPYEDRPALLSAPHDWMTWTPVGPGGVRGLARLLGYDNVEQRVALKAGKAAGKGGVLMRWLSMQANQRLGMVLSPHDIQFSLCEFDKYERVRLGQGRPKAKYKRS